MQLHAQLESTTLGDVLGQLHRARVSGVLLLQPPGRGTYEIHLGEGDIVHVASPSQEARLGRLLRRLGRLDNRACARLESCCFRRAGRPLGEVLVGSGVVSAGLLQRALRLQARIRLEHAFGLAQARISFRVGWTTPPVWSGRLSPRPLIAGRPRRRDSSPVAGAPRPSRPVTPLPQRPKWQLEALRELRLEATATAAEVRAAFRREARRAHPDCGGSEAAFQRLSIAYHRLLSVA